MFGTALIVFREVLEAALIIGIVAAATRGIPGRNRWIFAGLGAGLLGSLLVAFGAEYLSQLAEGMGQELFNAAILGVSVLGYGGAQLGAHLLGPQLGGGLGALTLAMASNFYERWTSHPATVTLVPGVLLLVPGSIGFRSFSLLLEQQVVVGVDAAFTMTMTAISLVAGLLLANILVPARRR